MFRRTLAAAALSLLLAVPAFAQIANCGQLGKKTNGGAQCDSASFLYVGPFIGTSAPGTPANGQMWFDTTTASPTCKFFDGGSSTWKACSTYSTATTQNDLSSFPGSPADGQFFIDWSHCSTWAYRAATSAWYVIGAIGPCTASTSNIVDNFTGSVITGPTGTMTGVDGGAAGNFDSTTGAHQHTCTVTFANASGGETTVGATTAAITLTTGNSRKISFSSIPTGGAGTTQRRIYCSKLNTTTPLFWVDTINDNSSTTLTSSGLTDATMVLNTPTTNYSAALNARWTVTNTTTQTTSGGCGSTGGSIICRISHAKSTSANGALTDVGVIADTDITAYSAGNYTIQFRVVGCANGWGVNFAAGNCSFGGLAVGNSYAAGPIEYGWLASNTLVGPLSGTNILLMTGVTRATVGGSMNGAVTQSQNIFPRASAFPFWIKFIKYGNVNQWYASRDGVLWANVVGFGTAALNPTDSTVGTVPSSAYTFFRFFISSTTTGTDQVMEYDTFTLTVNP